MDQLPGEQSWSWQSENSAFQAERYCSAKCKKADREPHAFAKSVFPGWRWWEQPPLPVGGSGLPCGSGTQKEGS